MLKKWLSSLFVLVIIFGLSGNVVNAQFSDVDPYKYRWAKEAIDFMVDRNVIVGYEDGSFRPEKSVTKAELTVMIYRLFPELRADSPEAIPGIDKNHWASREFVELYNVNWPIYAADKQNWNKETYSYLPEKKLTRWEVLMVLNTLFEGRLGIDDYPELKAVMKTLMKAKDVQRKVIATEKQLDTFWETASTMSPIMGLEKDGSELYCATDIECMKVAALHKYISLGIMSLDKQNKFYPSQQVTRAEVATILHRLTKVVTEAVALPSETSVDRERDKDREKTPVQEPVTRTYVDPKGGVGIGGNLYGKDAGISYIAEFQESMIDGKKVERIVLKVDSKQILDVYATLGNIKTLYTYEQLTNHSNPVTIDVRGYSEIKVESKVRYPERLVENGDNQAMITVEAY
ncbi:S-layer homology domain-containing protein [Paenibacillus sp. NPDC058071]|uniref:S-layer homology domain-containing protein n=1 Tax=Paenibacillus sp. NPDC058071 TaxID=3346326 RepID=UPI0036DD2027